MESLIRLRNAPVMNLLRKIYIKTTNLTRGYQDKQSKLVSFYKLWAPVYDLSIKLDPAYQKNLKAMISDTVSEGDETLDIGCGTGLGTIYASTMAANVLGLDSSRDMLNKLEQKINKQQINNIRLRRGFFPEVIQAGERFNSIITSFMLAHLSREQRTIAIKAMFDLIKPGGRVGFFAARGEVAPTFQTKQETENNLFAAGFEAVKIHDVDDIYRITTAKKPG